MKSLQVSLALVAAFAMFDLNAQHGTVSTAGTGTAGVHIQPDSLFPDVVVKTGTSSGSGFRVFNSGDASLLNVTAEGDVAIGTGVVPPERLYVFEDANANSMITMHNPNVGVSALAGLRAQSDVATVSILAHGSGRTLSRFGLPSLAGWAEVLSHQSSGIVMGTTHAAPLVFGTNNVNRLHIAPDGKVGIGTAIPGAPLHLGGTPTQDVLAAFGGDYMTGPVFNMGYAGSSFGRSSAFLNVRPDALAVYPNPSLRFLTANVERMVITGTGNVGIGVVPSAAGPKLHVGGDILANGNISANGTIFAKYQDVAEWVPAKSDMPPGTVVILNPEVNNEVMPSSDRYDVRVAGVVSHQPGLILGEAGDSKEQIATTGRVLVMVDATTAPIRIGDLLVTSDKPGMAMRSVPLDLGGVPIHRPGTIIGKALEPLAAGEGEILVLLSLQ